MGNTTTPGRPEQTPENEFRQFMRGLAADARLGRLFPGDLPNQSAEVVVLTLAGRLADAIEGRQPHPAHELLERIDSGRSPHHCGSNATAPRGAEVRG